MRKEEFEDGVKKPRAAKRPKLKFLQLGFSVGDVLVYKENRHIIVSIVDDIHVLYKGKVMQLTPVTCEIKHRDYTMQPSPFWIDKKSGKLLSVLYEEKYPRD
ncbi:MAG: hypothetical protein MR354_00485 [Bacteroides xylanisolvens]|nr:hypothetical protein [Bacteroides xylanisolvens]